MQTNILQLYLLGPPQFVYEGKPLTGFVSNKVRALLIYLAVTRRGHSRDALAELLWADTPTTAKQNLKKALSNLRRMVGVPLLEQETHLVSLDPDHYWVDVVALTNSAYSVADRDIENLDQSVQLYEAEFLHGFNTSVSYEFESWALQERNRLQAELIVLLTRGATLYGQRGDLTNAVSALHRVLALEPWREEIHRQVMRMLACAGDRGGALMQFDRCREALAAELDVEPDPSTLALVEQIRQNELPLAEATSARAVTHVESASSTLPRHHNLPTAATALIGREDEIAAINSLLSAESTRLVTILGAGGMGKTWLAMAVARNQLDHFVDGVYWVSLVALTDPTQVTFAIGEALQFAFHGGSTPLQQLCTFLQDKQLLLVLDNMEHLLDGVSIITELMANASHVSFLVTSRERLHLTNETLFLLDGLAIPPLSSDEVHQPDDAVAPMAYPAVALFLQQMQRSRPTYEPTPSDWSAIVDICHLVHGMPLGIQLSAAWGKLLAPLEIAVEIRKDLDFLQADLQDIPQRQQSLRFVFDQTWQRLSANEQRVLMGLSVFRGGFTQQAASAVAGATLPVLASLHDKALLWRTEHGRFELHELLRQFAAEVAERTATTEESHHNHANYFLDLMASAADDLKGEAQISTTQALNADYENLRVAWDWAVDHCLLDQIQAALEGMAIFHWHNGRILAGRGIYQRLVDQLPSEQNGQLLHANALLWYGFFCHISGQKTIARTLYEQALEILTALETSIELEENIRYTKSILLCHLGDLLWYSNVTHSQQVLRDGLAICHSVDQSWIEGYILRMVARNCWSEGKLPDAKAAIQQSLALHRRQQNWLGVSHGLAISAMVASELGEFTVASTDAAERLQISLDSGSQEAYTESLFTAGTVKLDCGQFAEAGEQLELAKQIARRIGNAHHESTCNSYLIEVLLHQGHYQMAAETGQKSLLMADKMGLRAHRCNTLIRLARVALVNEDLAEARRQLTEAQDILRGARQEYKLTAIREHLGYLAYAEDDIAGATDHLRMLLQKGAQWGSVCITASALTLAALLLYDSGQAEVAVTAYTSAKTYPLIAKSHWYARMVGVKVDSLNVTLSPDVTVTMQTGGHELDPLVCARQLLCGPFS